MDDREGSSSVLMTSLWSGSWRCSQPQWKRNSWCLLWMLQRNVVYTWRRVLPIQNSFSVKDLILLLFTMTENNGFSISTRGFCPNDAEPYINFRLYLFRCFGLFSMWNWMTLWKTGLRKRKRNTPTPAWGFSTLALCPERALWSMGKTIHDFLSNKYITTES